jgi:hypothetical protein
LPLHPFIPFPFIPSYVPFHRPPCIPLIRPITSLISSSHLSLLFFLSAPLFPFPSFFVCPFTWLIHWSGLNTQNH